MNGQDPVDMAADAAGQGLRVIDISVPIRVGMPTWPTDPAVHQAPYKGISEGGTSNVTNLCMGTHTGTHVDPPLHLIEGAPGADELPLHVLVGECVVLEDMKADVIDGARAAALLGAAARAHPPEALTRILFKTRSSKLWALDDFSHDYVALDADAAAVLLENGVRLVGVDYLSIEQPGGGGIVHRILLEQGVVIVEGLDLSAAGAGRYELCCLPLRIQDGDGAPARAVLRTMP